MTHLSTLLALGAAVALMSPIGHAQIAPAGPGHLKKFDLKVQVVIETAPGVYAPLIVPSSSVVSIPPSPPSIINCPASGSTTTTPTTNKCSELGLPSNSSMKLQAIPNPPINAHFYKWTDIPGYLGTPISNCSSPMASSITCSMAGTRAIQAVYKCNDHYQYNQHAQACEDTEKPGSIEVTKQIIVAVGSPPPPANTPFQITVACTPGGPTPAPFTLTVPGNPTHVVGNVSAGKFCNIAEAPPPVDPYYLKLGCSWTISNPGGQNVTMTNPATAMSRTVVNRWSCKEHGPGGHLTVNKVIVNTTGGSAPIPPTFDVAAQCMLGTTNTLNVTLPVPSNSGLSAAPLIDVGSICSISEGLFPKIQNLKQCNGAAASWTSSYSGPVTMVAGGATMTAANTLTCDKPPVVDCPNPSPSSIGCRAVVQIKRNKGTATYSVSVSPAAPVNQNNAPSTAASCVLPGGGTLPQTMCWFNYSTNPTPITLTASSSTGSLPTGFSWSGDCNGSGSSATCVLNVSPTLLNATANFP